MELKEYLRIMFNPSLVLVKIKSEILKSCLQEVNKKINDEVIITNKHKENMEFLFNNKYFDQFFKEDYRKFNLRVENFRIYITDKKNKLDRL